MAFSIDCREAGVKIKVLNLFVGSKKKQGLLFFPKQRDELLPSKNTSLWQKMVPEVTG